MRTMPTAVQGRPSPEFQEQIRAQAEAAREQAQAARAEAAALRAEADAIRQEAQRAAGEPVRVEVFETPPQQGTIVHTDEDMNHIPPEVVDLSIGFFVVMAVIIVGLPIARAVARWLDRKNVVAPAGQLPEQLRQLQESVDAVALEVERIAEAQRYTARLLTDRQGVGASLPPTKAAS